MKEYYYIHNVCYWYGNDRLQNIWKQVEKVKTIRTNPMKKNLFIVSLMCDDVSQEKSLDDILEMQDENLDIIVFPQPNSGGTVKSMWNVYKNLLQKESIVGEYFGTWEDDFIFSSPTYINDIKDYLDDYLFVGSLWEDMWFLDCPEEFTKKGKKNFAKNLGNSPHKFPGCNPTYEQDQEQLENYYWCEDPYVMKYENLEKIESLIGQFTLAPTEEKYSHCRHGIFFGEVGFPSRLYNAGGNFFGIKFEKSYEFLNSESKY